MLRKDPLRHAADTSFSDAFVAEATDGCLFLIRYRNLITPARIDPLRKRAGADDIFWFTASGAKVVDYFCHGICPADVMFVADPISEREQIIVTAPGTLLNEILAVYVSR